MSPASAILLTLLRHVALLLALMLGGVVELREARMRARLAGMAVGHRHRARLLRELAKMGRVRALLADPAFHEDARTIGKAAEVARCVGDAGRRALARRYTWPTRVRRARAFLLAAESCAEEGRCTGGGGFAGLIAAAPLTQPSPPDGCRGLFFARFNGQRRRGASGGEFAWARSGRATAHRAEAFGLDRGAADGEADLFRRIGERVGEVVIFQFRHASAGAADQELGGVAVPVAMRLDAADEGGEAFEAVDQAVFPEEFEGAVDGGGCCGAAAFAQALQQVIGAGGVGGFQDQPEHLAAQAGEADIARLAHRRRAVQQRVGVGGKRVSCHGHHCGRIKQAAR